MLFRIPSDHMIYPVDRRFFWLPVPNGSHHPVSKLVSLYFGKMISCIIGQAHNQDNIRFSSPGIIYEGFNVGLSNVALIIKHSEVKDYIRLIGICPVLNITGKLWGCNPTYSGMIRVFQRPFFPAADTGGLFIQVRNSIIRTNRLYICKMISIPPMGINEITITRSRVSVARRSPGHTITHIHDLVRGIRKSLKGKSYARQKMPDNNAGQEAFQLFQSTFNVW